MSTSQVNGIHNNNDLALNSSIANIMSIETDIDSSQMGYMPYEPPSNSQNVTGTMNDESAQQPPTSSSALLGRLYDMWDVDTKDVVERCLLSLNPLLSVPFLTNGMLDNASRPDTIAYGKKPDMCGPLWIYFTMVFSVFFSATMSDMFAENVNGHDIGLLTGTAGTLFAFTFVVPVVAWFAIQYFNMIPSLTLLQTVSLYGYSCTIWIPAVILAGSPLGVKSLVGTVVSRIIRGIAISIAFLFSAQFIYGNLYKVMVSQASQAVSVDKTKMTLILIAGVVVHAALALTIMFL